MEKTTVLVSDLADELGLDKSNLRRYIKNQGIKMIRVRTRHTRGQLTLALTKENAKAVREARRAQGYLTKDESEPASISVNGTGYFYAVQLVPELLPERVKLGFAVDPNTRLKSHQTAAPTAKIIKAWPCKRVWEQAAIDSLTRLDSTHIANEVFDFGSIELMIERGNAFFDLMPGTEIETECIIRFY